MSSFYSIDHRKYGDAATATAQHLIDCDADPFVPSGWTVESHRKGGQFAFDHAKIKLYLSPNQRNGKIINGNKLRKELANEPVLNANVLDYLLKNPNLIPEQRKKDESGNTLYIFFWGTIYRYSNDDLCVRFMFYSGSLLNYGNSPLDLDWDDNDPAALLASY